MAENGNGQAPNLDLAAILQTLANLPKTPDPPQEQQQVPYDPHRAPSHFYPFGTYHHPHPTPQHRTTTPTIDPTSITEWKHGLRLVNKIATQNPSFVERVQKLIKDQERNVRDWETGRQRLIEDQKAKRENEITHRAALSLPGLLDNTAPLRTPEREREELIQYDKKVYRACCAMVEVQSRQLELLGVPFFGVKPELLLPDDARIIDDGEQQTSHETPRKITKKQVLELQRKMLNHLMEMYGD